MCISICCSKEVVARDGIEPPTRGVFPWPRACHRSSLEERGLNSVDVMEMVARDGIEPPTPAFSGPRSTTELSGLGNTIPAGLPRAPAGCRFENRLPVRGRESAAHVFATFGTSILSIATDTRCRQTAFDRIPDNLFMQAMIAANTLRYVSQPGIKLPVPVSSDLRMRTLEEP